MANRDESAASDTVLALSGPAAGPLSIRAKGMVFADPRSHHLLGLIERVAPSAAPIMIEGDSGTGKELVARHIAALSGRRGPFLGVNCGAISPSLAESELFGHEVGAFTGAATRREGWFEAANHGTLFLDEIGDLPLALQVKLLRVLQEREVVRLGSRRPVAVDVRIITATNVDLGEAVSAGHFRLDLFYRLNIVQIRLPSLRERVGDIVPLAEHFLGVYSKRLNLPRPHLGAAAVKALLDYGWPGNIRELENVVHYALLVASDQEIRPEHLKFSGSLGAAPVARPSADADARMQDLRQSLRALFEAPRANLFHDVERLIVEEAYRECGANQVRSAELLGLSRNVLRTLLKKHGFLGRGGGVDGGDSGSAGDSLSMAV